MIKLLARRLMVLLFLLLSACSQVVPTALPAATQTPSSVPSTFTPVPTRTATVTATQTETLTPTVTQTATITRTATVTPTPSITPTATRDYPDVTVKMQANCRYGPGTAYLYRWGLYPNDYADVRGRNWDGSWLWIHPDNIWPEGNCWVSKIVLNETIDNSKVNFVTVPLPHTTFAGPPGNVKAVRKGNQVTVTWDVVPLSDDKRRGYLLEAYVCQNALLLPSIVQTDDTKYVFQDDTDCKQPSSAKLYTAEKHGYSDPVSVPWPGKKK